MKSLLAPIVIAAATAGCAAKSKIPPDLVRSQQLAEALQTGMTSMRAVPSTLKIGFSPEAANQGLGGSAIVVFVVRPNGRVIRESRTLVFAEGHQIFAKYICDALLAAKFEPAPTDVRGSVGIFPVFFGNRDGQPRDSARVAYARALTALPTRLRALSFDEALTWFEKRPSCSNIRLGIDPLYGGPPN